MIVHDLDIEDVKQGLADGSILLIDVREPHEFAMARIPGSVSMPLSRFDSFALPEPEGKRIVFSCGAGVRSLHALEFAQAAGLPIDAHYVGGFRDWVMSGEPVER